MTADYETLTDNGQLSNPANNIYNDEGQIQFGKGTQEDCFISISLPNGYRFTKYEFVLARSHSDFGENGYNNNPHTSGTTIFGETDKDFNYNMGAGTQVSFTGISTTTQTVTRSSLEDMGNVLYFKVSGPDGYRAAINMVTAELWFTAESNYSALTPAHDVVGVSAVDIPFETSKVDYGSIENRTYNGSTRIAYSSANVDDLEAYLTLYEAGSLEDGEAFDGTEGKIVEYKEGSISNEGDYFMLGKQGTEEQIYYIETPTYVTMNDGTKNPIGYRIVGATFEYSHGTAHGPGTKTVEVPVEKTYNTFYISSEMDGNAANQSLQGTYYLTANLGFSKNKSDCAYFFQDEEGYIRLSDSPNRYLKNGSNNVLAYNVGKNGAVVYNQVTKGGNLVNRPGYTDLYMYLRTTGRGSVTGITGFYVGTTSNYRSVSTFEGTTKLVVYEEQTVNTPAYTPSDFTLRVYDKTGTEYQEVEVTSETEDGFIMLDDLNNDAVKIGVIGVGLVKGSVVMQALDPYINSLRIVGKEQGGNGRELVQEFTASDFAVSGGKFNFFVPTDFEGDCVFSFKDLYSTYGDSTYYDKTESTNHARYSLVMSPY